MAASNGLRRAADREVETTNLQIGLDEIGEIMRGRVPLFPWPDRCGPRSCTKAALVRRASGPSLTSTGVDSLTLKSGSGVPFVIVMPLAVRSIAASSKLRVAMSFGRTVIYKSAWLEMMSCLAPAWKEPTVMTAGDSGFFSRAIIPWDTTTICEAI